MPFECLECGDEAELLSELRHGQMI
jgi:hypothetical protein